MLLYGRTITQIKNELVHTCLLTLHHKEEWGDRQRLLRDGNLHIILNLQRRKYKNTNVKCEVCPGKKHLQQPRVNLGLVTGKDAWTLTEREGNQAVKALFCRKNINKIGDIQTFSSIYCDRSGNSKWWQYQKEMKNFLEFSRFSQISLIFSDKEKISVKKLWAGTPKEQDHQ